MYNYEKAKELRKDFDEAFGNGITFKQLWFLVKFAKTIRKFTRGNEGFNNFCNMLFNEIVEFEEVSKFVSDENSCRGLQITMKNNDGSELTEIKYGV